MAVLIEGISVIVRFETLSKKFPGGWEAFERIVPNQTLCADTEIVRVGFMVPQDVKSFVDRLEYAGLEFIRDDEAIDIAVVDQIQGPTSKCIWLEFNQVDIDEDHFVSACRLAGGQISHLVTPPGWKFEKSISSNSTFVLNEDMSKKMKYLRHENGNDVYLNLSTGKEMFVGRSGKP